MQLDLQSGLIDSDERDSGNSVEVVIIHCISLPPGQYGGTEVVDFFCNKLDPGAHPYFTDISNLCVSSHFYIRRDGELIQFVPSTQRAWHAGESVCLGKPKVNNFSVGIELEGLDTDPEGFTEAQYQRLNELLSCLKKAHPAIHKNNVFAHSDIAPGRKPDPGPYFEWSKLIQAES